MLEDEKGKKFLQLIDKQNSLQWKILEKLISLIKSNWENQELKKELESLIKDHASITKEINGLDDSLL